MNILYFGGQKSGKSNMASAKALSISANKPYYVATYDNSYRDSEMTRRIDSHIAQRENDFVTIEQSHDLTKAIEPHNTYLIDCLSMWIFNNITLSEDVLVAQLERLFAVDCNIVFVLNDVGSGVIPMDSESRRFVDLSGIIGQFVASQCDEVYRVSMGLSQQLK